MIQERELAEVVFCVATVGLPADLVRMGSGTTSARAGSVLGRCNRMAGATGSARRVARLGGSQFLHQVGAIAIRAAVVSRREHRDKL